MSCDFLLSLSRMKYSWRVEIYFIFSVCQFVIDTLGSLFMEVYRNPLRISKKTFFKKIEEVQQVCQISCYMFFGDILNML